MPQVAGRRVGPRETARIRAYLEDKENPLTMVEIADIMVLSRRTIERLKLNFELFDAPYPPKTMRLGRPPTLTEEQQGFVLQFFTERPYAKLEDATAAVWERYDVNLSAKSVSNILFKHKWTRTGFKGKDRKAPGAARRPPALPTADEVEEQTRQGSSSEPAQQVTTETDVQWSPAKQTSTEEVREPPVQHPRVELPEISIPAFFLESTGSPMGASRPAARRPCPTCGCSSREHQNV